MRELMVLQQSFYRLFFVRRVTNLSLLLVIGKTSGYAFHILCKVATIYIFTAIHSRDGF